MVDEFTQLIKITIDAATSDAIKELENIHENVEKYKQAVLEIAEATKTSFKVSSAAFKKFADLTLGETKALTQAVKELEQEQLKASRNIAQQAKISTQLTIDEEKAKREAIKETIRLEKEAADAAELAEKRRIAALKERMKVAKDAANEILANEKQQEVATKHLKQTQDETTKSMRLFGREIGNVGDMARLVFGSILGVTAITALRNIIRFFQEATKEGLEFARTIFKLSVSARALERRGLDVTLESSMRAVEELRKEFGIFNRKELMEGIAQVQFLTRNMGFAEDQMMDMARISASLAVLLGTDFNDAAKSVALFLSSGYAEALQRAGISVNRLTIQQEAYRMGLDKSFLELTEQERAQAGLNAIMRQGSDPIEDAIKFQDELAGSVDASTASIAQQRAEIGLRLVPVWEAVLRILSKLISTVSMMLDDIVGFWIIGGLANLTTAIVGVGIAANMMWQNLTGQGEFRLDDFIAALSEARSQAQRFFEEMFFPEKFDPFEGEDLGDAVLAADDTAIQIIQAFEDLKSSIIREQIRSNQRITDAEIDLQRDLERIDSEGLQRRREMWVDFYNRILDITLKAAQQITDAQSKAELDRSQINRQFNQKVEDSNRKHRQKEEDAESKFQEKLRQLRENFLVSLEDAIRARDASQISRLRRRFSIDQARLKRQASEEKKSRDDSFEEQKRSLKQQREERLRTLQEELDFRIRQIILNRDREIAAEKRKHDDQLEELQRSLEDQRDERELSHEQTLEDIDRQFADQIELIASKLGDQFDITKEFAERIRELLEAEFGKGGATEQIYNALIGQIEAATEAVVLSIADIKKAISEIEDLVPKLDSPIPAGPSSSDDDMAQGGTIIARKRTVVSFGGHGPEVATFTPIGRTGANVGRVFGGSVSGQRQRIELFVGLQDGLFAEVVNTTLGEVADVIVKVQRSR
jgi:hypothetical protein